MPGAEVRYPNEVSPGDFLSAANVKTVRKNVAHRSIQQRPECANVQNAAHTVVFSSENVQIVRLTAGENVLGARRILSAGNVLKTFNLEAH